MNFSSRDVGILIAMSIAVISISFVFPQLGMTSTSNVTQPPEFSMDAGEFNVVGDFPDSPGTATSGTIEWDQSLQSPSGIEGLSLAAVDDNTDTLRVELQNGTATTGDDFSAIVTFYNASSSSSTNYFYNLTGKDEGYSVLHTADEWSIRFTIEDLQNAHPRTSNFQASVNWKVLSARTADNSGGGWLSAIPIVGGLIAAGDGLVGMLAYLGNIIFWGLGTSIEILVAAATVLFNMATFFVALMSWLTTNYVDVISNAQGFASVFVAIPGIILSAMLAKLVAVVVSMMPTT